MRAEVNGVRLFFEVGGVQTSTEPPAASIDQSNAGSARILIAHW
jgi:hypothetical protein